VLRAQIAHATQRQTVYGERLRLAARALLRERRDRFANLALRLKTSKSANAQAQRNAITRDRERTLRLTERARRALTTLLQRQQARVEASNKLLAALSYRSVLARGFALVRDEQGAALHAAAGINAGARLTIEFADGRVGVLADGDIPATPRETKAAPKPAIPKRKAKVDQGDLF
jgi:exodeoxyribonuclease VII large subunit